MCYSAEVKAAAISALLQGQGVTEVATKYKLPLGTVKCWKHRALTGDGATVSADEKKQIGDLLIRLVVTQLESAIERAKLFGDRAWLEKQEALGLANLHGVDIDKVVRLLEAFTGAGLDAQPVS